MNWYPIIKHFNDIEPFIDSDFFYVTEKEGYSVVGYRLNSVEAFPPLAEGPHANIRREFRGMIFDKDGKLISRPLHKFFNYGEHPDTSEGVDWSSALFLEKLDGSMVRPIKLDGKIRWATKNGITEMSEPIEEWLEYLPEYEVFAENCIEINVTPIFEWCSPDNQIVIKYNEPKLILLAIRDNKTGVYFGYDQLERLSNRFKIPVVQKFSGSIEDVKAMTDGEGIVAYTNKGILKVKSDWYVQLHRAKEAATRPVDIIRLINENKLDDILPLLIDSDRAFVDDLHERYIEWLQDTNADVIAARRAANSITRKEFALNYKTDPYVKSLVFKLLDKGEEPMPDYFAFVWEQAKTLSNDKLKTIVEGLLK